MEGDHVPGDVAGPLQGLTICLAEFMAFPASLLRGGIEPGRVAQWLSVNL